MRCPPGECIGPYTWGWTDRIQLLRQRLNIEQAEIAERAELAEQAELAESAELILSF